MIINQVGGGNNDEPISVVSLNGFLTQPFTSDGDTNHYFVGLGRAIIQGTMSQKISGSYEYYGTNSSYQKVLSGFNYGHHGDAYCIIRNNSGSNITAVSMINTTATYLIGGSVDVLSRSAKSTTSAKYFPSSISSVNMTHNYEGLVRAYFLSQYSTDNSVAESYLDFEKDGTVSNYYIQPSDRFASVTYNILVTRFEKIE